MDDISKKREQLFAAYPGDRWRKRVTNMHESQVVATWMRLKKAGKI